MFKPSVISLVTPCFNRLKSLLIRYLYIKGSFNKANKRKEKTQKKKK